MNSFSGSPLDFVANRHEPACRRFETAVPWAFRGEVLSRLMVSLARDASSSAPAPRRAGELAAIVG